VLTLQMVRAEGKEGFVDLTAVLTNSKGYGLTGSAVLG